MIWLTTIFTLSCTMLAVESKCGYTSCHPIKQGYINVHVIAHTHDDVGWIRTLDEYYYDTKKLGNGGVRAILTSSFEALLRDTRRRFIYVESAFLFKWWREQNSFTKISIKRLIDNGQLEIVSGGWTMNDEATTNYQSIIDQFTLGLRKLNETFGPCGKPKVGWQVDTFGHSNEMASIFAQLGFDGLFLGRISYHDKMNRFRSKTAEMVWQGNPSLGKKSEIFTSVLYNTYWPPPGFCFDTYCGGKHLREDEIHIKWKNLVEFMNQQRTRYRTNNILLTMGGDFYYTNAELWFSNLDKIIEYGNKMQNLGLKYNLMYSTPSCYLKAVHDESRLKNMSWPLQTADFFPYAMESDSFWTGFYTSRPTLKRYERLGNNFLQVCKQLYVLGYLESTNKKKLNTLKRAVAVLQHHDAITGTEQEHVANDYVKTLSKSIRNCNYVSAKALNNLVQINKTTPNISFKSCLLLNISQCDLSGSRRAFVITIYNPLSKPVNHFVQVPVKQGRYSVKNPKGTKLVVQTIPIPREVLNIPGRRSKTTQNLIFIARHVPPLGFKSYYVEKVRKSIKIKKTITGKVSKKQNLLRINRSTGSLKMVSLNGRDIPIRQEFLFYRGRYHIRPSGAYIFEPAGHANPVSVNASYKVYKGVLITEVHQKFNEWISQIIRMYRNENYVEFQWLVGPIPYGRNNFEIISRFSSNIRSGGVFFTDSNGRQLIKRIRYSKPSRLYYPEYLISQNYYPVTSKISIRDVGHDLELAILTDRSQGGTGLRDGEIELMVHRNAIFDDRLGVDEILNEKAFGKPIVVRGSHYLTFGPYLNQSSEYSTLSKDLIHRKLLDSWTFLSRTNGLSFRKYKQMYRLEYSGLESSLPNNVQILTMEPLQDNYILLRLEHVFAKNEHVNLSEPIRINLKKIFTAFQVLDIRETTLGANEWLEDSNPLRFKSEVGIKQPSPQKASKWKKPGRKHKFKITLKPMQIRTFIVKISFKASPY